MVNSIKTQFGQQEELDMTTIEARRPGTSIPKLAESYDVSESLLYRLANSHQLPGCRRLGKRFIVHLPTFEAWLQSGMGEEFAAGADRS